MGPRRSACLLVGKRASGVAMSNRNASDLRWDLVRRLATIGVEVRTPPNRNDGFACLFYSGKEIGHFHSTAEVDLRLGRKAIESEGLVQVTDSTVHPKRSPRSPWIELRFSSRDDVLKVLRLVQLAIMNCGVD